MDVRAIPEGMHTITPHLVVRDAARAAEWYASVLHLFTADVDALWERAVGAGAEILHPLADQFWGDRQGQVTDPFGHRWGMAQHLRDVPREEIERAAAAAFGG